MPLPRCALHKGTLGIWDLDLMISDLEQLERASSSECGSECSSECCCTRCLLLSLLLASSVYLCVINGSRSPAVLSSRPGRTPACRALRPPSLLLRITGIRASPRWQERIHRHQSDCQSRRVDLLQSWGGFFSLECGVNSHGARESLTRTNNAGQFSDTKPAPDRVTLSVHEGSPPW